MGLAHSGLISVILLVFSVYIRLKLNETPIFQKMASEGKGSKAPLTESFFHYPTTSTCCSRCSAPPPVKAWSGTRVSSTRCSFPPSR